MIKKGKITISKPSMTGARSTILITIEEQDSGVRFVEATMSLEDFAEAITGAGLRPCDLELRGLDKIGLVREHTTHQFPIDEKRVPFGAPKQDYIDELMASFRAEGWKDRKQDWRNSHRVSYINKVRHICVTLERRVKPSEVV